MPVYDGTVKHYSEWFIKKQYLSKKDLARRELYGLQFFTDKAVERRQKQFNKALTHNSKIQHYFIDKDGWHVYRFRGGHEFKCRGQLPEQKYL